MIQSGAIFRSKTTLTTQIIMAQSILTDLINREGLPESFQALAIRWYQPLAAALVEKRSNAGATVIGVQGSQGSGKSTLAVFLKHYFEEEHGLRSCVLSLDDFYFGRAERQKLAATVHPLLQTRGVPGTHEVELAMSVIDQLQQPARPVRIPRFDKAVDDRVAYDRWELMQEPIDFIIFEGWCVGAEPQVETDLIKPMNALEAEEDAAGVWRRYVNNALAGSYQSLFSRCDALVVLQAPSFECVYEWRWLQEQKLHKQRQALQADLNSRMLDENGVRRFIAHYERLTRHCLLTLPKQADWVLQLNHEHNITSATQGGE